jgi:hypothetical protein
MPIPFAAMLPLRRSISVAVAGLCVLAGPAAAAYAPKLDVKIDPATPSHPVAITSVITQAAGETPNKTVKVSFPAGFGTNPSAKIGSCTPDQEAARACPENTKIGDAKATASIFGVPVDLAGPVHYGGPQPNSTIKIIVFLEDALHTQPQTIEGFVSVRKTDNGFDTLFDNLPNTLTTSFTLAFSGANLALTQTPAKCGTYTFNAQFTSQNGEQATGSSDTKVSGCIPTAPRMGSIGFTAEKVRPGKSTTIDFTLSEDASVVVDVKARKKHGKRLLRQRTLAGKQGTNELRLKIPRKAKPGRYKVTVTATDDEGLHAARGATFTVRKPKKR